MVTIIVYVMFAVGVAKGGPDLQQLRHRGNLPVASQRHGRAGLQRMRSLLQAAQRPPTPHHEEGQHSGHFLFRYSRYFE